MAAGRVVGNRGMGGAESLWAEGPTARGVADRMLPGRISGRVVSVI